jgi:hypothetical protein
MRETVLEGRDSNQREPDTLHRILRTTFSGDRQCKMRLQTIARLRRDPHRSPGSPPQPSSARNTSSPGWRHKGPWPITPSSHQRGTTFSSTAGSCPESSTRRSICASTVTSADTARTARNFSSTSGTAPARVAQQHTRSQARPGARRSRYGFRRAGLSTYPMRFAKARPCPAQRDDLRDHRALPSAYAAPRAWTLHPI